MIPVTSLVKYAHFYLLSLLPIRVLYFFSDVACLILSRMLRYRRGVVLDNLAGSFPEKPGAEINHIAKDFYSHFCDIWIESLKCLTISEKQMKKRFTFINPELIRRLHEQDRSIVLLTGHTGNWEMLCALPLTVPHRTLAFYLPLSSAYFDGYIRIIRERFGVEAVDSRHGPKILLELAARRIPTCTIMVADQSPAKTARMQWIRFLNRDTAFFSGAEKIASMTGQAVIFPDIRKITRGFYEVEFRIISADASREDPSRVLEIYAEMLERSIRETPYAWLWSHKRWKLTKTEIATPAENRS